MHFHMLLVVFIIYNFVNLSLSATPHWDYGELGPDVWKDIFPTCGASSQSPINIKSVCTTYQAFEPFQFSSAYGVSQDFILTNNGHTIVGQQVNASAYPLTISGGGLTEPFTFVNFHLHWGENYNSGSEHQINGQKFTGEIHFVHGNAAGTQYAALGIFMQTGPSNSSAHDESDDRRIRRKRRTRREIANTDSANNATLEEWNSYFTIGDQLEEVNETVVISLKLGSLLGSNLDNFYRYAGSLTTPPCTENVIWTVFKTPIVFKEPVIDTFRSHIYFEDYRGPQPINNRTVYRNFVNSTPSSILDYQCCSQIVLNPGTRNDSSVGNSILYNNKQFLSYFYVFSLVIYIKNFIF